VNAPYISTVVPAGCERYAIRLGAVLIGVLDIPHWMNAVMVAREYMSGGWLPEGVTFWPADQASQDGAA
jgi:hypothetical protein